MKAILHKTIFSSRRKKQIISMLFDCILLQTAILSAFSLRLGSWYFPDAEIFWFVFGAPVVAIPIFLYFGLYKNIIRFIGFSIASPALKAVSFYAFSWGAIIFIFAENGVPRSVVLINWLVCLVLIIGSRLFAKTFISAFINNINHDYNRKKNCIIYGAGNAGIQLLSALAFSSEYHVHAMIDDSPSLHGHRVAGIKVHSPDELTRLINKHSIDELLIAIPSISRKNRSFMLARLEALKINVRILPGVSELAGGKVTVNDLRELSIIDLLGRDPVEPVYNLLEKNIKDKIVLITGAGGSIGSELARQIVALKPAALVLFERSEYALYSIEKELISLNESHSIKISSILGDITNKARVAAVFKHFMVDTVYHAAAYKHVPMVEFNIFEGINNNVFGTLNCAEAAIESNVSAFIFISTDKAVRPSSTMGASKRLAELILQAIPTHKKNIVFSIVRFGNVLDSSGSVVPLFKKQISNGGPLTVTDKKITRFFMTISEAVQLVLQAGSLSEDRNVFVLDMGKSIKIDELAKKMIRLSGLEVKNKDNPQGDIEIKYTGLRPGEKLYEELLISKNAIKTKHPLIMRTNEKMIKWMDLQIILLNLADASSESDYTKARNFIVKAIPEYKPQCKIMDHLSLKRDD